MPTVWALRDINASQPLHQRGCRCWWHRGRRLHVQDGAADPQPLGTVTVAQHPIMPHADGGHVSRRPMACWGPRTHREALWGNRSMASWHEPDLDRSPILLAHTHRQSSDQHALDIPPRLSMRAAAPKRASRLPYRLRGLRGAARATRALAPGPLTVPRALRLRQTAARCRASPAPSQATAR